MVLMGMRRKRAEAHRAGRFSGDGSVSELGEASTDAADGQRKPILNRRPTRASSNTQR